MPRTTYRFGRVLERKVRRVFGNLEKALVETGPVHIIATPEFGPARTLCRISPEELRLDGHLTVDDVSCPKCQATLVYVHLKSRKEPTNATTSVDTASSLWG